MSDDAATSRGTRRIGRLLRWSAAVLVLLAIAGLGGVGWYYSDEVLRVEAGGTDSEQYDLRVEAAQRDTVILSGPDADRPGVWGLRTPDGYSQVGPVTEVTDAGAVRPLRALPDTPSAGDPAQLDGYAYPDDPAVLPFAVEEVAIPGPLGDYPATYVPGERDTWVIAVHGRGARRSEAHRLLPTVVELGLPALSVSYRNDADAPASPDGTYRLGWTEWEDVAAAVAWARDQGARDVVLVGYSMGGAIVSNYLREAGQTGVAGLVLDSPVLDWGATIRLAAIDRGVPTWLTPVAQTVITIRTGIRWQQLDLLDRAEELDVPILLFHGVDDATVPVATSDALAEERPDLVTYERVAEAGHVQAWNVAPDAYAAAVRDFLERVAD